MPRSPSLSRRRAVAMLAAGAVVLPRASRAQTARPVVVASKIDTEGSLLGSLIALALEHLKIPLQERLQLGPTKIVRSALVSGEIDIYPEYTGNGAFFYGPEDDPRWKSAQSAYDAVRALDGAKGLVWLPRAPANNSWLIAVRGDLAKKEGLSSMADFAGAVGRGLVKLAASAEFVDSPAALPSFERVYGFAMPRDRIVVLPGGDTAVTMRAAAQGISGVNAAMVYGTDGGISALDLAVMQDTKGAQIVYEPAPVVRDLVLQQHQDMAPLLERIFATLDQRTLQELNGKVAVDGEVPRAVAKRYLDDRKLLG
jgi:osmoprotectant transport system substrate-binding protein